MVNPAARWLILISPFFILSTFLLIQVFHNPPPGDLQVFYQAGLDVRMGVNPWLPSEDSTNFQFLYGPINALICAALSYLGERGMYLLVCVTSIILIPFTFHYLGKLLNRQLNAHETFTISSIFLASFPLRANLQYGQFVIHYSFLLVVSFYLVLRSLEFSPFLTMSLGITPVFLLDFKPHLFLPFIPIWFFYFVRNRFFRIGVFISFSIELFLSYLFSGKALPLDWIERIVGRGTESKGLQGFYNIFNWIGLIGVSGSIIIVLSILVVSFLLIQIRFSTNPVSAFILLYLALFPALHPQDFVLIFLVFLFASLAYLRSYYVAVVIGFSIFWSSNEVAAVISMTIVVITILYNYKIGKVPILTSLKPLFMLLMPSIFAFLGLMDLDNYRIFANYLSVLLALAWLILHLKKKDSTLEILLEAKPSRPSKGLS
jgi:hypothetical protein